MSAGDTIAIMRGISDEQITQDDEGAELAESLLYPLMPHVLTEIVARYIGTANDHNDEIVVMADRWMKWLKTNRRIKHGMMTRRGGGTWLFYKD